MRNADEKAVAVLRGSRRPDAEQEKRFAEFLLRTYGREIPLTFEEDKMLNGFTLTVGTDVYDWSLKRRKAKGVKVRQRFRHSADEGSR